MQWIKNSQRFRVRILFLQLAIVLITLLAVSVIVMRFEINRVEDSAFSRVALVAEETAQLAPIGHALARDPENAAEVVAPLAHLAESASGVDYVTIADLNGIRVAHPDPGSIGQPVSSDHESIRNGETFRGVEEGPLGVTLRVKQPVFEEGKIVGTISVGILQSKVRASLVDIVWAFAPWIILAVAIGSLAAALVERAIRRIYRVDPEEVDSLKQAQQAVLYGVSDGVLGVDGNGRLTLVNGEARRLLDLPEDTVGQQAEEVLDQSLVDLLRSDSPEAESVQNVLSGERVLIATRREAMLGPKHYGRTLTLTDHTELEETLRELRGQRSLADTLRAQAHEFTNRLHLLSGLMSIGEYEEAKEHIQRFSGARGEHPETHLGDPTLSALFVAKQAVASEAGVRLELHPFSAVVPGTVIDDDAITVAANLLANAIEAAGDGGVVSLHLNAGPTGVRIAVSDSGPGIKEGEAARLVQLGYSSKTGAPGAVHGRGIGLALVDRIRTRRGGVLKFGSSDLGGAEVIVAWPPSKRPMVKQSIPVPAQGDYFND
ncbi:MAG: ATP-binding protein [Glutamicibacter sp.]|uniref:sensor histidine kinase n=1 Tax=Glutamicibacter sp. TaxID=1931995 RepID=UPI002FCAD70C